MRVLGLLLVAACGRIGFQPGSPSADAAAGDTTDATLQRAWVERLPVNHPTARHGPVLAYHATRQRVILYGGRTDLASPVSDEMWEYDGNDWTLLCAPCTPGPRHGHVLVYDRARDRLVLFGGETALGGVYSNELWEWDGATWMQISAAGAPSPRVGMYFAYDAARARTVIFGGLDASGLLADLYEWDGTTWTARTPGAGPVPRVSVGTAAAFDPLRGAVLMFGGTDLAMTNAMYYDDVWKWNGVVWQQMCAACTGTKRSNVALAFDPGLGHMVLTGGFNGAVELSGTWELDASDQWSVSDSMLPPTRDTPGIAYDERRDTIVLFGGNGNGCIPLANFNCDETYERVAQ